MPKKTKQRSGSFELEVQCSIEAAATMSEMFMCEVRIPRENSVIFYLFVCLIVFVGDEVVHIYISACVSAFSEGVVQLHTHIHTNQLMP